MKQIKNSLILTYIAKIDKSVNLQKEEFMNNIYLETV